MFEDETEVSLSLDDNGTLSLNVANASESNATRFDDGIGVANAVLEYANLVSDAENAMVLEASNYLRSDSIIEERNRGMLA